MTSKSRRLTKSRVAQMGHSVAEYLMREKDNVAQPSLQELTKRLRSREPVKPAQSPAEILREHRGE